MMSPSKKNEDTNDERSWLTTQEAARELGIPYATLTWRARNKKIPSMINPLSGQRAFSKSVIDELKRQQEEFLRAMDEPLPPIDKQ